MINGFTAAFNTFYRLHKTDIKLNTAIYFIKEHHPSATKLYKMRNKIQTMQEVEQSAFNSC